MPVNPGFKGRDYDLEPTPPGSDGKRALSNAHTPWQLLIEKKRLEHKPPLSFKALHKASQIASSTLFAWMRSPEGGPRPSRYTSDVNKRLAKALGIPPEELAKAYRESFQLNDKAPAAAVKEDEHVFKIDGLKAFLALLRTEKRGAYSLPELEKLAQTLMPPKQEE